MFFARDESLRREMIMTKKEALQFLQSLASSVRYKLNIRNMP